jgi:3-hexulose-6-phosphate synthase/6-phospho-3-hexuloisomerase
MYSAHMQPILQVALDLLNGPRAITIAQQAIDGGADWIEAGTPLIKAEGMDIIRQLKHKFPQKTIIADMKTMDTGAIETEMASKAGAQIICLLGVADISTIQEAVKAGRKYGTKIMVDLIGVPNYIDRALELEKIGIDYLCIHVGIDQQMTGIGPLTCLKKLAKTTTIPIAVAGGLNSETVADVVKAGAYIIIIGNAITGAQNVTKATQTIKQAMRQQKIIPTTLFKKYDKKELITALQSISTPNISDAMHRKGAMIGIRPIKHGFHIAGQAYTVKTMDGDWAKPVEAIDTAPPRSILVIDAHQGTKAVWGELATCSALQKNLTGVVIDGAVRDLDDLLKLNFPIFCRHITAVAGEPKGFGETETEIQCGGQTVQNGDWIIGDDSGVVVIPQDHAQEITNRAHHIHEIENRIRQEIKDGGSLGTVTNLKKWEKVIG